jgi:hypothetical protein
VNSRVLSGKVVQGFREFEPLPKVLGTQPLGVRIGEIGHCRQRPRRVNHPRDLGEKRRSEPGERVRLSGTFAEKLAEQTAFLGGNTHPLPVDRIEAADRVAKRQQSARKFIEPLKMPPDARRKPEARDLAKLLGPGDRVVDGRGPQLPRIGKKTIVIRWVKVGIKATVVLYVVLMVAIVFGVDLLFFRNRFWERLIVNIGIVLVFAAFYLRFLKRP